MSENAPSASTQDTHKGMPQISALLRSHFFSGLLVVIPLGVIAWILGATVGALWQLREWIPEEWRPESFIADPRLAQLLNAAITIVFTLALALGVSIVGWISKQYLGRQILRILGDVISHIPVVRSIYSALDQLLRTITSGGGQQFNRVVYIEYPRKDVWALAFVTGEAKGRNLPQGPKGHLNVYVPTTPNPTSGFHLIVPEADVRESGMSVEEAFKTILSLGIAQSQ